MNKNNKRNNTPTDLQLEKIKAENRKKHPELAKLVDRLMDSFGQDQVTVTRVTGNWGHRDEATTDDGSADEGQEDEAGSL
nr:hypothetical protein [Endozoicomonas sp.]